MKVSSYNNIIVNLLVSPRYRILRHLVLFFFILALSVGFVYGMEERGWSAGFFEQLIYFSSFGILFWLASCLNIYVLTPRLLLKNKWWLFFLSLAVLVLFVITIIFIIQITNIEWEEDPLDTTHATPYEYFKAVINLSSAFLSFLLLFAGTSSFVLFKYWILDMQQSEELESETLQMELKLLENQINPHFLFNMLNNANIMIKKDPHTALHIIEKLEEMLNYLMNDSLKEKVYLHEEVLFLSDFLELEKTRRDYSDYTVSVDGDMNDKQISPLLFIAFVENAVKHNQDSQTASYVNISFKVSKECLIFICKNSIPANLPNKQQAGGIGLVNIKRRLDLLYKSNYHLEQTKTDVSYTVKLELKL